MANLISLAIVIVSFYSVQGSCPVFWTEFRGSCYSLPTDMDEWLKAHDACETIHGHLVTIESAEENEFVKEFLRNHSVVTDVWIGANDIMTNGDYRWVETDNKVTFTDWITGEPNNAFGILEDCVELEHLVGFKWNDELCYKNNRYVCETRPTSKRLTPEDNYSPHWTMDC